MQDRHEIAYALLSIGLLALVATGWLLSRQVRQVDGSGDVGVVEVYAQLADGPTRLWPERSRSLPRPQDLAFRFSVKGTGPRVVRIEVNDGETPWTAYEQFHYAPANEESLDYVLELDETSPDRLEVFVTVEAPHTNRVTSRFPLHLVGGRQRFWER
ncbi:MAG: hypothetical protein AAFV29_15195 [Myxococcota bacterium]